MRICVVIPVYNEGEAVGFVVDGVRRKGFDVVVVNDGSTDSSGIVAQEHGAIVLHNSVKTGKGSSLRRGFDYALKHNYDGAVAMDGDGQHDAEDLDKIIRLAHEHPVSVVTGSRMSNVKAMPRIRLMTNKVMSWMISRVCGCRIFDTQCGFRYISAEILRHIVLESSGYEIESEVLIKSCRAGYPVYSVNVCTIYSSEKSKIHPVKDTWRFLRYFLKEIRSK
jgi:glycosyltransferase involved in cell wall biosynthesis